MVTKAPIAKAVDKMTTLPMTKAEETWFNDITVGNLDIRRRIAASVRQILRRRIKKILQSLQQRKIWMIVNRNWKVRRV